MVKWYLGIVLYGLMAIGSCECVAEQTYEGKNSFYNTMLRITFEGKLITWEVNGQRITPVKQETIQSTFPHTRPVLCLYSREGAHEYVFCGMFHNACCPMEQEALAGLYTHHYSCGEGDADTICVEEFPMELRAYGSESK